MESRCYREIFLGKEELSEDHSATGLAGRYEYFSVIRHGKVLSFGVCVRMWDNDESHMVDVATMRMGLSSCHG